jgi:tyrosine-protein phosphatase SIW14
VSSTLVDKDYPEGYQDFMQSSGIRHVVIKMAGTKKADIPHHIMNTVLDIVLDPQSQPVLLHCNQGRVRDLLKLPLWYILTHA